MAERRYEYAPAGTLLGLLQRGRGLGARMAAEDPAGAADLVYACIRWEWRWDSQADHRALYLARLVRDLDLPLGSELGGSDEPRDVLHEIAEPSGDGDLPALIAELERCWVEQAWCGPAALARRLAPFGAQAAGAASLLRRFWLWTPHSSERAAYLEALAKVAPVGLDEVYVECLWDCEANSRLLGVEHAPSRADVRQRLAYLRDDPMEETAVRDAAALRLGGGLE